jgi:deazaflavin-dependent oxidoreductase (nitroreductase family)
MTIKTGISVAVTGITLGAISALVFRSRPNGLIRAVSAFNKRILNPAMLRFAGKKSFYAAALHHTGRSSGRRYVTPVRAESIHDGVLIPLPYGKDVDWLQNVLSAGSAELVAHGTTMAADHPTIIPAAEARRHLTPQMWRTYRTFGVEEFLRLTVADQAVPTVIMDS